MSFIPPAEFGPFIKHFRESKHLSQLDVERRAGVAKKTLDRWERGKVKRIHRGTLEQFATGFNMTFDDLINEFEAYQQSIVSDATQTPPNPPPDNHETVMTIPRNPTEPIAYARNNRSLMQKVLTGIVILSFLVVAVYALITNPWIQSNNTKPVIVSGQVLCMSNKPVEGIWVNSVNGRSGWTDLRENNSSGSEVIFEYILTGDAYNLHVGCGGSKQHWNGVYITEAGSGAVYDRNFHFFTCQDASHAVGYGSCELQY